MNRIDNPYWLDIGKDGGRQGWYYYNPSAEEVIGPFNLRTEALDNMFLDGLQEID